VKFVPTPLAGAFVIELERINDDRGFFARTWCEREFTAHGLDARLAQCSVSFNERKGTLRGLHYQEAPFEETKLVRCTRGAIFDVIVDLRPESPSFRKWFAAELNAENCRALYVPVGFAHGFQTLVDRSEVFYQISEFYRPELARGIRWDEQALRIDWPLPDPIVSERDRLLPELE